MKNNFLDNTVITRKISDLSEAERAHLDRLCEIAHQKNGRLKEESRERQRQYEQAAQKKRGNAVYLPLLNDGDVLIVSEVDMDWHITRLSISRTLPIYIVLSTM
jgi:hypothetical protein